LLAVAVWLALRLFPALSAAARSVIWLNVLILLALLPIVPLFSQATGSASVAAPAHSLSFDPRWSLLLAVIWLALSVVRATQLVLGAIHLSALSRRATPVSYAPELAPYLQYGGRTVQLCASDEVARPSVLGFLHPRILLPPALLQNLSPAELQQVVVHEMEHLRRADDWTNLLQKIALALFPLNPALAWVERRLCAERELACDDRVLSTGAGRKAYALCLAHLAEFTLLRRGFSLVLGAWERRPELVRRVHRILSQPARSMGRRPAIAATGALIAAALGCALVLARAPQLVSFTPAPHSDFAEANALDPAAVARSLGGTTQLVKAVMPRPETQIKSQLKPQPGTRLTSVQQPHFLQAVTHRPAHRPAPASQLADLRLPPLPATRTLMVFTAWTETAGSDTVSTRQVLISDAQAEAQPEVQPDIQPAQPNQVKAVQQRQPVVIPARYAVVATPAGWLIIQI
jgi:beta-lactamase regulating signal transducer with metallopeptidase domain